MSDYPRMLYHADGRNLTVEDEAAEKVATSDGFGRTLTDASREVVNNIGAATVPPSGQSELANMIADIIIERLTTAKPSDDSRRPAGSRNAKTEG